MSGNSITLLVLTDGRSECMAETVASAEANLFGTIERHVIHDDSGDVVYREWLGETFPDWTIVGPPVRSGFAGSIASAWAYLKHSPPRSRYVFHCEDDFTFRRPVDLDAMATVLDHHRYLMQMALRRQPWNPPEAAAGGVVECHPEAYRDVRSGRAEWLEHELFWTTNPSLYRADIMDVGWPEGDYSESRFGKLLLERGHGLVRPGQVRFGYWGNRASGVAVTHTGRARMGVGY